MAPVVFRIASTDASKERFLPMSNSRVPSRLLLACAALAMAPSAAGAQQVAGTAPALTYADLVDLADLADLTDLFDPAGLVYLADPAGLVDFGWPGPGMAGRGTRRSSCGKFGEAG